MHAQMANAAMDANHYQYSLYRKTEFNSKERDTIDSIKQVLMQKLTELSHMNFCVVYVVTEET